VGGLGCLERSGMMLSLLLESDIKGIEFSRIDYNRWYNIKLWGGKGINQNMVSVFLGH
jgi:hypothetical protein